MVYVLELLVTQDSGAESGSGVHHQENVQCILRISLLPYHVLMVGTQSSTHGWIPAPYSVVMLGCS